jgi:Icc protein
MKHILQISDPHIAKNGELISECLDTVSALRRLVVRISEVQLEVGPIDAILVSGDISDDGTAESYELFKSVLKTLNLPLFVVPGNHDQRYEFRNAFFELGYLPDTGKLNWHKSLGFVDLIGLDTLIEGQGGGELDDTTLDYLESKLKSLNNQPVIVIFHHPPFKSGIKFMDSIGLMTGIERLTAILSTFTGNLIVVCGHIHRNISTLIGGHSVISAPSVCSSFLYNIHNEAPVGFLKQEGGMLLHQISDGFKSIRIEPTRGAGPFAF